MRYLKNTVFLSLTALGLAMVARDLGLVAVIERTARRRATGERQRGHGSHHGRERA